MELYDAMRCAPTSRRFTAEPVDTATIERALDAARFAPSGGNRQGWRVVVVTAPETRRALRDLYLPHWRAYVEKIGPTHPGRRWWPSRRPSSRNARA